MSEPNEYYALKVALNTLKKARDPWHKTWTRWVWVKSRIGAFILRCRIAGGWISPERAHQLTREELDPPIDWTCTACINEETARRLQRIPWRLVDMPVSQALDKTAEALGYWIPPENK